MDKKKKIEKTYIHFIFSKPVLSFSRLKVTGHLHLQYMPSLNTEYCNNYGSWFISALFWPLHLGL